MIKNGKENVKKLEKNINNAKDKKSSESGTEEPPKDAKINEKGLKIMTLNQLLTRLPILLAQKQAGNNNQNLNNEIRQIIYSLYSSRNMPKTVYNHLMNSL